ncbi:MAG: 1-acyl-sn-glycerol-3-phosphate acyltransferase [Oscillospiraceae bacterium]|jgi:1-acyl-sn-glycerol-3-phosphate acyltransferase|nr:1-acyl-sn-glycerol-3-phosphate acyltransferase [Oscillospiraceae bacterium]
MDMKLTRHKIIYGLLRRPVALFLRLRFNYSHASAPELRPPYLVLANHTTDYDPLMVACGMRGHMYFVASEHVYRAGFLSRLLGWAIAPIARVKGASDASSAMKILKALRRGACVCVFAEGERSWNGLTGSLHPSTARLARAAGVPVVTYKLSGGYLTSPRWASSPRRGAVRGETASVYLPEDVRAMTDAELSDAIERDIYVDAFADQRARPVRYRGGASAEKLETAIYACPECGGVGTLTSEGETFSCVCGFSVRFGAFGFFEGERVPFDTVAEWDLWQERRLREFAPAQAEEIYSDADARLYRIGAGHSATEVARGALRIGADGLRIGGFTAPVERVSGMAMHGRGTIVFSAGGSDYEIKCARGVNMRKYLTMFEILRSRDAARRAGV